MLYKAYKAWSLKPYTKMGFAKRFAYYFVRHHELNNSYYNLNVNAIELLNKVDNGKIRL